MGWNSKPEDFQIFEISIEWFFGEFSVKWSDLGGFSLIFMDFNQKIHPNQWKTTQIASFYTNLAKKSLDRDFKNLEIFRFWFSTYKTKIFSLGNVLKLPGKIAKTFRRARGARARPCSTSVYTIFNIGRDLLGAREVLSPSNIKTRQCHVFCSRE